MGDIVSYFAVLIGFLSLLIATFTSISSKMDQIVERRCNFLQNSARERSKPVIEWDFEYIFSVVDLKLQLDDIENTRDKSVNTLMQACVAAIIISVLGLFLMSINLFLDWIPLLDILIGTSTTIFVVRIIPVGFKLASNPRTNRIENTI